MIENNEIFTKFHKDRLKIESFYKFTGVQITSFHPSLALGKERFALDYDGNDAYGHHHFS